MFLIVSLNWLQARISHGGQPEHQRHGEFRIWPKPGNWVWLKAGNQVSPRFISSSTSWRRCSSSSSATAAVASDFRRQTFAGDCDGVDVNEAEKVRSCVDVGNEDPATSADADADSPRSSSSCWSFSSSRRRSSSRSELNVVSRASSCSMAELASAKSSVFSRISYLRVSHWYWKQRFNYC